MAIIETGAFARHHPDLRRSGHHGHSISGLAFSMTQLFPLSGEIYLLLAANQARLALGIGLSTVSVQIPPATLFAPALTTWASRRWPRICCHVQRHAVDDHLPVFVAYAAANIARTDG